MAGKSVQRILDAPEKQLSEKELCGNVFWISWAASAPQSASADKVILTRKAQEMWEALLTLNDKKAKESPMANFWNHLPLLESLRYLKTAQGIDLKQWERWSKALLPYIEEDFQEYGQATNKNWVSSAAKVYPNADAQHAAVMSAAWLVYGDEKYKTNAHEFIAAMEPHLRPPGAWLYYRGSTPIPLYHGFEIIFLGRCYQLTGDPLAAEQIRRTKDYYPYTYSPDNTVEFSTSPSWKQMWNPAGGPYHAVEMVAWLCGDGYNRWFADLRAKTFMPHYWIVYCGEAYDAAAEKGQPTAQSFPDQFIIKDESLDGFRGRFGKFSWAGTRGKNAMSFASALLTDSKYPAGYDGYIQFAHIGIPILGAEGKSYYDSLRLVADPNAIPTAGYSYTGKNYATLHVSYIPRLQSQIDIDYDDWRVDEYWLFTAKALIGVLRAEALKNAPEVPPCGVIRMGPMSRPHSFSGGEFAIGNLRGNILASDFKKQEMIEGGHDEHGNESRVELRLKLESVDTAKIVKGTCYSYVVMITNGEKVTVSVAPNGNGAWKVKVGDALYDLSGKAPTEK